MPSLRAITVSVSVLLPLAFSSSAARLDNSPKPAVTDKVTDQYIPVRYDETSLSGLLGARLRTNDEKRLLRDVDPVPFLAGFQKRPGSHPWIGEHVGKFLHAAGNMWAYSGDEKLKAKMDRMVRDLIATQEPDGYLGTYAPDKRFGLFPGADWDVWCHKYCLIGLLAYYQMTGDQPALEAARKAGDLLCKIFGDGPGQKSILSAGTHVGMAATSVLEPMDLLYRLTGEKRYLDFCLYITRAYDGPKGPKIITTLLDQKSVFKTANGKAYEMMSNLVGLCDLYRLTGEQKFLDAARIAWEDIAKNRLYITGTTSSGEHFKDNQTLPADERDNVGETCATVTWLQLNLQLLRLTGEPRFADELERTVYNHLLGAQNPTEGNFCYFTPLLGRKDYKRDINCCQSSGPRGISLIPQMVWGRLRGGLVVWFYTPGEATIELANGNRVQLKSDTDFPQSGRVTLTVRPQRPAEFPIYLRKPSWCRRFNVEGANVIADRGGLIELRQTWKGGESIVLDMDMTVQILPGGPSYPDCVAVQRGPQVLALDAAVNPTGQNLELTALASTDPQALSLKSLSSSDLPANGSANELFETQGLVGGQKSEPRAIRLVPFADASQSGTPFRVWLLRPDKVSASLGAPTAAR